MVEHKGSQRSNPRKQARAAAAERHTEQVAVRFGKEIERSSAAVRRIEAPVSVEVTGCVPEVRVVDADSVAAILENAAAARSTAISPCSTSPRS